MRFLSLRACDFRSLRDVRLSFSPDVNVIVGNNGQGKTSLLEALYLLAGFRSFRGAKNRELVMRERPVARLAAEVSADGILRSVQVDIKPGSKRYLVDGKEPGGLSEWVGRLLVVTFSPDDLYLVKGEPELRRRWLDRLIFLLQPTHLHNVMGYHRALKARNVLLKDGMFGRDLMLLDSFDETLAKLGMQVAQARRAWMQAVDVCVAEEVEKITGGAQTAHARYESEVCETTAEAFLETLIALRPGDVKQGRSSYGVHHDDVALEFSGADARRYASQGEQRALTLALKLAETRLVKKARDVAPVLLLDDVAGELDFERNRLLYEQLEVGGGQVFLAGTGFPAAAAGRSVESRVFVLENGKIAHSNQRLTSDGGGLLTSAKVV